MNKLRRNIIKKQIRFAIGLAITCLSITAHAALLSRLGGAAFYDTDLDITWLADANTAASQTFGVSGITTAASPGGPGLMTWGTASDWVAAMNVANYLGYSDWRLPVSAYPDASCSGPPNNQLFASGFACTGSEMGYLFYNELGGVAGQQIGTTHNDNYNLFSNLLSADYWSGTEMPGAWSPSTGYSLSGSGYILNFYNGAQGGLGGNPSLYAWAVRDGDVSAVPIPGSAWLLYSGLIGLISLARRNEIE